MTGNLACCIFRRPIQKLCLSGHNLSYPPPLSCSRLIRSNLQPSIYYYPAAFDQIVTANLGQLLPRHHRNKISYILGVRSSVDGYRETSYRLTAPLKTDAGERCIKLPEIVLDALKIEKCHQAEDKIRTGGLYVDQSYDGHGTTGALMIPIICIGRFKSLLKSEIEKDETLSSNEKQEKTLPKIRFHDLRHSHATALLIAGVPVKVISERLGHSSIDITQDIYSHVLSQMQDHSANEIDKLLTKIR